MREPTICRCDWRTRVVGDGCDVCNPVKALEYAKETISDLEAKLETAVCEVWRGDRKVVVYHDDVLRIWGPTFDQMTKEPRNLYTVQFAFDWLYASPPTPRGPHSGG